MAGINWGMAAGGAQDAMQQMLEQRILEEKMALAQRQQQAEEAYRAAQLQEQAAGRMQQGEQFGQTHGLNVEQFKAGAPKREADVANTQAQTGGQIIKNVGDGMDVGEKARIFKARPAAEARIAERPGGQAALDTSMAGITSKGVDPNDLDGAVQRSFVAGENQKDRGATIAAAGARANAGPRPMTRNEYARQLQGLRKEYNANVAGARQINQQGKLMDTSWANYDANPAAASQGILVTFQKILDKDSVVRESEYLRSIEGTPIWSQMQGAYERLLKTGGAGIPKAELDGYRKLAHEWTRGYNEFASDYKSLIQRNAEAMEIDPNLIFIDGEFGGAAPAGQAPAAGPEVGKRGTINGRPVEWDGKGWKAVRP
jgi:hypothetical protein